MTNARPLRNDRERPSTDAGPGPNPVRQRRQTQRLDLVQRVETPERVDLDLIAAGPFPRLTAWLIDAALRLAILLIVIITAAASSWGGFGQGLFLLVFFLLEFAYPIVFESVWGGATPGKHGIGQSLARKVPGFRQLDPPAQRAALESVGDSPPKILIWHSSVVLSKSVQNFWRWYKPSKGWANNE